MTALDPTKILNCAGAACARPRRQFCALLRPAMSKKGLDRKAAAQAFVEAGVPHVVAVRREAQLQDKAACVFAEALYFALFKGPFKPFIEFLHRQMIRSNQQRIKLFELR